MFGLLFGKRRKLDQIRRDIASPEPETRGRAMHALLVWARKDVSIRNEALPIFRAAIPGEQDAWAAASAADGIELIAGVEAGRAARLALLNHPAPRVAWHAALSMIDPYYIPALLDAFHNRDDAVLRTAIIRTLGRMRDPGLFETIAAELANPKLRLDAIDALGELGDARAIPLLEPLLNDHSDARDDDRGCVLKVSQLADQAIRAIGYRPL